MNNTLEESEQTEAEDQTRPVVVVQTFDTTGWSEDNWQTLRLQGLRLYDHKCTCEPPCRNLAACINRVSQPHDGKSGWLAEDHAAWYQNWNKAATKPAVKVEKEDLILSASEEVATSPGRRERRTLLELPQDIIENIKARYVSRESKVVDLAKEFNVQAEYIYQCLGDLKRAKGERAPSDKKVVLSDVDTASIIKRYGAYEKVADLAKEFKVGVLDIYAVLEAAGVKRARGSKAPGSKPLHLHRAPREKAPERTLDLSEDQKLDLFAKFDGGMSVSKLAKAKELDYLLLMKVIKDSGRTPKKGFSKGHVSYR